MAGLVPSDMAGATHLTQSYCAISLMMSCLRLLHHLFTWMKSVVVDLGIPEESFK